jgi:hypothetical protein
MSLVRTGLIPAALIGIMLRGGVVAAGPASDTAQTSGGATGVQVCTLAGPTLLQAYTRAIANGFRFACVETDGRPTSGPIDWVAAPVPVLVQPTGELVCASRSKEAGRKVLGGLFANKNARSAVTASSGTRLRNSWELEDFSFEGANSFGGFTSPPLAVGVVRYRVNVPTAGTSYAFKVTQVRIKKAGGSCADAITEAFGPDLGTPQDTVCPVNIVQAQAKAMQRGYSFECVDSDKRTPPLPIVNTLRCVNNTGSSGLGLTTHFFRNQFGLGAVSTMKNGWRVLSYAVSGVSTFGGYWEQDEGKIYFEVRMPKGSAYSVGVHDLKLAKPGGNCANVLDEAF